jgi:hypothetical protein
LGSKAVNRETASRNRIPVAEAPILQQALDQQDLTRSRADALLAILKAMRQAREELAVPAPTK